MYVCMYVCIYVCMYMYVCMYVCMYVYPHRTWHHHGARLIRRALDPHLAVDWGSGVAPAHDPAARHEGARVEIPRGDGGGGEA